MNTTTATNFSGQRLRMTAEFYYPRLRLALILYPAASLSIGLITAVMEQYELISLTSGLLGLVLSVMFYFFPLLFFRNFSPITETMLPATAAERFTFFVAACLIVNPIITYIPFHTMRYLTHILIEPSEMQAMIQSLSTDVLYRTYGLSASQSLPPLATCMFIVVTSARKRMGAAIGLTIATVIILMVIGAIYGAISALNSIPFHQIAENQSAVNAGDLNAEYKLNNLMGEWIISMIMVLGTACLLYSMTMTALAYRKFKKMQV